jgi:hypothetical protein
MYGDENRNEKWRNNEKSEIMNNGEMALAKSS